MLTPAVPAEHAALQAALVRWVKRAQAAGFDEEGVDALFAAAIQAALLEEAA